MKKARFVDACLMVLAFAFFFLATRRDGRPWERLADVRVPNGILPPIIYALLVRQRRTNKAVAEFGKVSGEFGTFIGNRMKQSDERDNEVLELTRTVKRLTSWLVVLTVVLGVIGVGSIVATLVYASKH
jgi:hypothetical protein